MIDLDRATLERLLPAPAGSPDWDDVMSRSAALESHRRRRLVVLAAAALVLVVGTASALAVRAFFIDRGFIGIPPVGATASAPKQGKLVLFAWGVATGSRSRTWVYADGRLIWWRESPYGNDVAVSANRNYTGLLEQRLTKRGVSLLRSEALSTGLFGSPLRLRIGNQPCFNVIEVRNGERLVPVTWQLGCPGQPAGVRTATPSEERALLRLVERLVYPASWLPASAWQSRRIRAYVPREFEIWYGDFMRTVRFADILKPLPATARAFFRARKLTRSLAYGSRSGSPGSWVPQYAYRVRVTTEEARSLHAVLMDAGLEVVRQDADGALAFRVDQADPIGGAISVYFNPILPHGEPFRGGG